jgi:hypothetical protein
VLDDRTAEDESILCVTDNWVSLEDEAYVRVVGGNSTKWDRALARYSNYEYTFEKSRDADIALLHDNIGNPAHSAPVAPILSHALKTDIKNLEMADQEPEKEVEVTEDMKLRVKRWYTETATEGRDVWIGLRLNSQYAFWTIDGIFYRNALDFLVYPDKDEFNERGVMKTGLEPKDHDEL